MSRLGNIRRREGEIGEALRMNEEAVSTLRAIGDRGGVAMALLNLGMAVFDQGDVGRSRSVLEEALSIRRQQRDKNNTAQATSSLARVALAQDRIPEAETLIAESIALRQELGESISLAQSKMIESAILLKKTRWLPPSEARAMPQRRSIAPPRGARKRRLPWPSPEPS